MSAPHEQHDWFGNLVGGCCGCCILGCLAVFLFLAGLIIVFH